MKRLLRGWVRWILILVLSLVGMALFFHQTISHIMMTYTTDRYQVSNVSRENIEQNEKSKGNFDFSQVAVVSTQDVLAAQMSGQKLNVIGGIAIPDLEMNLPVFKGIDNTNLLYGAGTMKENQTMGEGNYALASHHVFDQVNSDHLLFSPLERAEVGQKVYLTDKAYIYTYTITSKEVVAPTDVEVIEDVPDKTLLTLVTCDDLQASNRLIVQTTYDGKTPYDQAPSKVQKSFTKSYTQ